MIIGKPVTASQLHPLLHRKWLPDHELNNGTGFCRTLFLILLSDYLISGSSFSANPVFTGFGAQTNITRMLSLLCPGLQSLTLIFLLAEGFRIRTVFI
jgi:hypothetical protein